MFKKLFANRWLKWSLIGFGFFIAFWLVYFYITFFTDLWYYLPGNYRFQAAFSRLQLSCQQYPYGGMCKGHCGWERSFYRKAIADYLNKEESNIARDQVKEAILDASKGNCFRTELVDSVYLSQQEKQGDKGKVNPPQFLADYLLDSGDSSDFIAQEILDLYGGSIFSGSLSIKLIKIINDPNAGCEAKYNAIEDLGRYGNDEVTRPIFQKLIEENKDPDHLWIAYEASKMLSAPSKKDRKFVKWCEEIIWGDYDSYVKEKVLRRLGAYGINILKERSMIVEMIKKIYYDDSQNKFVRKEAAGILRYANNETLQAKKLYLNPEISDEEFDEHYVGFPKFPKYCRNNQE